MYDIEERQRTLFLSTRLMMTFELLIVAACFASAASAFSAFLCASFSARFWASTEREDVAAARASVEGDVSYWHGLRGFERRHRRYLRDIMSRKKRECVPSDHNRS